MWAASQLSVLAIGFTCSDHLQPGRKVARPTAPPSVFTSSSWPVPASNGRVSSGESRLLRRRPDILTPVLIGPLFDVTTLSIEENFGGCLQAALPPSPPHARHLPGGHGPTGSLSEPGDILLGRVESWRACANLGDGLARTGTPQIRTGTDVADQEISYRET